ncbi:metal-dependent hydrolase [Erythrobacter sp. KY5]|uniref:metal-dependent hydrolase n=1 Tax=Erythrobacter sp. KY5 TaxID=2011159 RepID=UPI000DBEFA55|nr:metal-dependent hydrolase [Erythrobacter sp. KY5]AWW74941.1 metal-dependent hydrolase [Erythrobacter sp. KY5]
MDNLTHSLVGAVMAQTGLKRKTGLAMPALVIGANLPDVDAACFFWLEGTEHLGFRRGITHGPPALVLLPLILAGLLWAFDRWQAGRGKRPEGRVPVHFGWLYALSFLGCLSHPALDWLNVYGVRLLEPFSSQWFYGDTLFIIDLWLWALLSVTIWWSIRRERGGGNWTRPARIGSVLALLYIALNGAITWFDYNAGGKYRAPYPVQYISSPVPFYFWEREHIARLESGRWISSSWDGVAFGHGYSHSVSQQCVFPDLTEERKTNSQLDAFLFWSRAPFGESNRDGSLILRDARFYDPRARDRFALTLPDMKCMELVPD